MKKHKMISIEDDDLLPLLRLYGVKLRAVAYLIETHHDVGVPLDSGDILWGIGEILTEISRGVVSTSQKLEKAGFQ